MAKERRAAKPGQKSAKEIEDIQVSAEARDVKTYPVAGIGASAGGIEALVGLIGHLPVTLNMVYVIVQHLSPDRESILPELLQKKTKMKVHLVEDGMEVLANNIYVIPPNKYMTIDDGHLKLTLREQVQGVHHSIDHFFSTLAAIYQTNAIGIVLSGIGTDGTLGLQAIKAEGGITFAQDFTAMFGGMPDSAGASGYADLVLPVEGIVEELTRLEKIPYLILPPGQVLKDNEPELRKIHSILHNKRGVDFTSYKQTTINRRILRRVVLNKQEDLTSYAKYLMANRSEVDLLYQDLLINVTTFFREPGQYLALIKSVFPNLLKGRKPTDPIRIWIAACATGEEAYSFAISLFEYLGEKAITTPIQIFATDLSEPAIEKARIGIYSESALANVSPQRLKRFFARIDGHYQIIKSVRDVCIFATHNLIKDPPFSRMDIISCQNVLIYLETTAQKKVLGSFHYALKPTGYMLLGKSETIGASTDLFEQIGKEQKIYTKKQVQAHLHFDLPSSRPLYTMNHDQEELSHPIKPDNELDIERETDRLLLSRYIPASVLINKDMQIIRFQGAIAGYLQPAAGKASLHLMKMVRDELIFELRSLIHRARKEDMPQVKEEIHISDKGYMRSITIEVAPVRKSVKEMYFLIVFKENGVQETADGKPPTARKSKDAKDKRIMVLEQELKEAREHMKIMSEEFEATREELQTANEEILSSNEELQSINEELETSKEELQSSNEELTTINEELQHRNDDLKEAVEYTEAIVHTVREPLLVLNADMRIRTANRAFYTIFKCAPEDVEGNYLFDIGNCQFDIPELKAQLADVISKNLGFRDIEVSKVFPSVGEKIFLFSAMRMSYEDKKDNKILLSLEDVTQRKRSETVLMDSEERFRLLVQNSSDIICIFTADGTIQYISESLHDILGYSAAERVGKNIFDMLLMHPDDEHIVRHMLETSKLNPQSTIKAEFRLKNKEGAYRTIDAAAISLLKNEKVHGIVVNARDITQRKQLESQKEEFIAIASHELKTPVTSIKAYMELLIETLQNEGLENGIELATKISGQVARLSNLVTDLLDVTNMSEGQLKLRMEPFDPAQLIATVIDQMQQTTEKHNIVSELRLPETVIGDKDRIGQVLINFISNAIKYSPNADKITVQADFGEHNLSVCVEDYGVGLSSDLQGRIFEPFFRANDRDAANFPGLGLGLYIAAEIIRKHNGKITVESKKGEGARFCFTLPL